MVCYLTKIFGLDRLELAEETWFKTPFAGPWKRGLSSIYRHAASTRRQ